MIPDTGHTIGELAGRIGRAERLLDALVEDLAAGVKHDEILARYQEHKRLLEELDRIGA